MAIAAAPAVAAAIASLSLTVSFSALFAISAAADSPPPPPYTNHTVGDAVGWFFNATSNSSAANYSQWAAANNFFLGDYLIFNTNSNNTVIQTYNATTYTLCNSTDDDGNDTSFYYDGSGGSVDSVTVPVPLTQEGANYFFSAAADGIECLQGMRFQIKVAQGRGLPPSLNQPPPPPYVEKTPPPPPDIMVSPTIGGGGAELRGVTMCWLAFVGVLFLLG